MSNKQNDKQTDKRLTNCHIAFQTKGRKAKLEITPRREERREKERQEYREREKIKIIKRILAREKMAEKDRNKENGRNFARL